MKTKRRSGYKQKRGIKLPKLMLPRFKFRLSYVFSMLLMITYAMIVFFPWPTVKKIDCQLEGQVCPGFVEETLRTNLKNTNLLSLNQHIIRKELENSFPTVILEKVSYRLPFTIRIYLTQKQPFASISSPNQQIIVDELGSRLVVDDPNQLNLPQIRSTIQYPPNGNIKNATTLFALRLIKTLHARTIAYKKIDITNPTTIVVQLPDDRLAVLTNNADLSRQVTTLQLILNTSTINPELPIIDLRFDKPVLKPHIES